MTFLPSYVTVCVESGSVQCDLKAGSSDLYFVLYPVQPSRLTPFGATSPLVWLATAVARVAGRATAAWLDTATARPAMARMGVITSTQADRCRINIRPLMRNHLSVGPAPRCGTGSTDATVGGPNHGEESAKPPFITGKVLFYLAAGRPGGRVREFARDGSDGPGRSGAADQARGCLRAAGK